MSEPIRIGFLVDSLVSRYQLRVFASVQRVARRHGARVIGFQGTHMKMAGTARRAFDGSFLYELAGPQCVDGLVLESNILATGVGIAAVREFCQRTDVPVVSVGRLDGFPYVAIDNSGGLRAVIEHLVRVHGRKQFAFISGPRENPDSLERELTYRTVLATLGVAVREDRIVSGTFLEASGASAMRELLDRPGEPIDAVVAANDQMAMGAVHTLRSRRFLVPADVAVVGFDDDDYARNNNPPLTTVAQPIDQLGERAGELLLRSIAGHRIPAETLLLAEPVIRRSCGCPARRTAVVARRLDADAPLATALRDRGAESLAILQRLAGRPADSSAIDALVSWLLCEPTTDASTFRDAFERSIASIETEIDALQWIEVLAPIDDEITRRAASDPANAGELARRIAEARLVVNEVSARTRMLDQLHTMQRADAVRTLGNALVCARNLKALGRVLNAGLANLGINYCCVCLFAGSMESHLGRVATLYDPSVPPPGELLQSAEQLWRAMPPSLPPSRSTPVLESPVFSTRQLVHSQAAPASRQLDLLVYPLVYAEDALGYVLFDAPHDPRRAWALEGLAGHLSSAVYAILRADDLRNARELAEQASAAKSEFVAVISHEVRTPLTAIMGHLDLCLQTQLSREQQRHLSLAQTSSRALLGILNDILDFAKIEARKLEVEAVRFDLDEVIEQVIATYGPPAFRKGVELVVDVASEVPRWLTGDPLRLTQVLLNLVGNAIKFSAAGHVVLEVEAREVEPLTHAAVKVTVRDTGIGLSPAEMERIFDPFTQADSSTTRCYGGTGLGLTVSRRLVELMGGKLTVDSERGVGSAFAFDAVFRGPSSHAPVATVPALTRALVCIEHELQRRALSRLLLANGIEVTAVTGVAAGRERLRAAPMTFDLVFLDAKPEGVSDVDLVAILGDRPLADRPAVVMVSAPTGEPDDPSTLERLGNTALLYKPFQRDPVIRAVVHALASCTGSEPARAATQLALPSLARVKVLLVQDDPVSREFLVEVLVALGAQVMAAVDGEEAVRRAQEGAYDIVLMDVHLPKLDGCSAARAIRAHARTADLPILAVSASGNQDDRRRCMAAGMNAYLATPIATSVLAAVVAYWTAGVRGEARPAEGTFPGMYCDEFVDGASEAAVDVEQAMRQLGGDAQLHRRLLVRFAQSHHDAARDVREALHRGEHELAERMLHTLSSAAANIGAVRLYREAQALESLLRAPSRDALQLPLPLDDFDRAANAAVDAVRMLTNETSPSSAVPPGPSPPPEIQNMLDRLRVLVAEHDTAAIDCVDTLRHLLEHGASSSSVELLRRLEASIGAYDFELAREHLAATESWLRRHPSAAPPHALAGST